jgi:hypothetical protein
MKYLSLVFLFGFLNSHSIYAGEIFKIEIGKDYNSYSDGDLKRRVWELERAVFQLQQKVFEMEMRNTQNVKTVDTWVCKTEAMNEPFTASGSSRAVAENAVMEKCKASPKSNAGFFCDRPTCSQ